MEGQAMNPPRLGRAAKGGSRLLVAALVTVLLGLMACATGIEPGAKPSPVSPEQAGFLPAPAAKPQRVPSRPAIAPSQLTARADPALGFAVSQDGSRLALTISGEGFASIWLQSADPGRVELPRRLAAGGGDQYQPAFFPSGDKVVFVGTGHDVKGDLYLVSAAGSSQELRRLTGRETADRAPCISPDGGSIYFHRSRPGEEQREIAVLAMEGSSPARVLDIPRDAAYPAISPDGSRCAFVSSSQQEDAIFVFDLQGERLTRLTGGEFKDAHPSWSPDGEYVVFSRCTPEGACSIWQVRGERNGRAPHPLTSSAYSARQPRMGADRLFFLSDRSEVANIWYLPATGQIPPKDTAAEQMGLARELEAFYPPDLHLAALGYRMVRQRFPEQQLLAAEAGLQAGNLYEQLEEMHLAKAVYQELIQAGQAIQPHSGLAAVRLEAMQARREWSGQVLDRARRQVLHQAEQKIAAIADKAPNHPRLLVQSLIVRAKLLIDLGGQSQDLLSALDLLDQGLGIEAASAEQQARALFIKADVFQRVGRSQAVIPLYARILEQYPDIRPWSERAVERILDFQLAGESGAGMQGRIGVLRRIADRYRSRLPRLAMGAQNRIGDLYFEAGKWAQAKLVYRQVLEEFQAGSSIQLARARLALAEILYREERFAEALRLYESEMAARPFGDSLYRLAWQGYVRKNLEAAEHHFQLGEISRARTMFSDLMRQDPSLVQAHRGYIQPTAAK